jgi:hypothetical protein
MLLMFVLLTRPPHLPCLLFKLTTGLMPYSDNIFVVVQNYFCSHTYFLLFDSLLLFKLLSQKPVEPLDLTVGK